MHGVPAQFDHAVDSAQFRHLGHCPGVELYRAHIVRHAFEPHTHAAFGLGAIEAGVERFRYGGAEHLAPPGSLVLMNPDALHTGRAETEGGWRYRMIYVDTEVVAQIVGDRSWWFDTAVQHDPQRAQRAAVLLDRLWCSDDALELDGLLLQLLDTFRVHAKASRPVATEPKARFERVIDYLHAYLHRRIRLQELADVAHLSPYHFQRRFRAHYHATPQQMLMALRLLRAKQLLATGAPAARVASLTGLTDQAHLTRAFARRYGVTPVRYQLQVRD